MATQPTFTDVKALLVTRFATALVTAGQNGGQVQVAYAWPGPKTKAESVFFGRHPVSTVSSDTTADYEIPTMKAGRKHRQESYDLTLTVWVFRPELTSADAEAAEVQADTLAALVEDVLADNPQASIAGYVQHIINTETVSRLVPFESGWACDMTLNLHVEARLT